MIILSGRKLFILAMIATCIGWGATITLASISKQENEQTTIFFPIIAKSEPQETAPGAPIDDPLPGGSPISSMIDWSIDYSNVGIDGGIPDYSKTITVQGRSESDIEQAIQSAEPFTKIILPAGVYDVGTIDINKSNIMLVGGGGSCGETILRFGSNDHGIHVSGHGGTGPFVNLTSNGSRNARSIDVANASGFNVGDYVMIRQNDDSNLFRADLSRNPGESWVKNNAMQINRVAGKNGNTLNLEGGLNLEFKTGLDARVAKINNMITGVGIENLTIERTVDDGATGQSGNISFINTANSWVKGVHSKNAVRAHIYLKNSYKNELKGNYLERSYNNGEGGHGYGVRLEFSTDILTENNIAKLMRHSYLAQAGSSGNVFGYNYSADPYGEGHGEIFADLNFHGGFTFSNLFEGNQAQMAKIDNYHASSTGNLFFRNRIEQDIDSFTHKNELMAKGATTPHIWIQENQYFNSALANEISFPGANRATQTLGHDSGRPRDNFTVCKYTNSSNDDRGCGRTRETTVNHGNHDYLKGETTWDSSISNRGFPASAYRNSRPSFWGNLPWPMYGPDTLGLSENQKQLPAKTRFIEASQGSISFCQR